MGGSRLHVVGVLRPRTPRRGAVERRMAGLSAGHYRAGLEPVGRLGHRPMEALP